MALDSLPRVGLGTDTRGDHEQARENVRVALEAGYRHLDTAQGYENERHVGRGLAEADVDREDVFLATKVATENLSYDDVLASTEGSLDRLGVDYVDLLYVHWPHDAYDPEETLRAFDELYEEGTIRNVGVSNFSPALVDEARDLLDAPIAAHQVECHPLLPQDELREYAVEHDHWLVAYSPLANGELFDLPVLRDIAADHDTSVARVALAWLLSKEHVAAVPRSSDPDHIADNLAARDLDLTDGELARIDDVDRERRVIDPDFGVWNQ